MESCELLIVDDQVGIRRLLYEVFADRGYQVEVAAGGQEAIKKAVHLRPRIILLDMKMPGMNGLETLRELKKLNIEAVVVLMTAYGELEMVMQAKKLGLKHYINKPFDLEEIVLVVKKLMPDCERTDERIHIG